MKKKDLTGLRSKSIKELSKLVSEKTTDLKKKSVEMMAGKEKNLKMARALRKEIAQIKTLVKESELLEKLKPKEESK